MRLFTLFPAARVRIARAVRRKPKSDCFILKRHGAVVLGKDLTEARFNLERLEFLSFLSYHLIS